MSNSLTTSAASLFTALKERLKSPKNQNSTSSSPQKPSYIGPSLLKSKDIDSLDEILTTGKDSRRLTDLLEMEMQDRDLLEVWTFSQKTIVEQQVWDFVKNEEKIHGGATLFQVLIRIEELVSEKLTDRNWKRLSVLCPPHTQEELAEAEDKLCPL